MDRRHLLARFGAVLGTASLGGCLERYRDVAGETGDETTEETSAEETTTGDAAEGRPTLGSQSFTLIDSGCGTLTNEASVEFDSTATSVAVTGTIPGSNACYVADLADVRYDPEAGTLDVTVASMQKKETEVCADCIAEIDYEASFDFEGGLPETVTVVHEARGESKIVVEAQSD